jgi:hypothetical protein
VEFHSQFLLIIRSSFDQLLDHFILLFIELPGGLLRAPLVATTKQLSCDDCVISTIVRDKRLSKEVERASP